MDDVVEPIQHLSTLVHTEDFRVAEFTIAPKKEGPYHYHTSVVEHCVCLEGTIRIEMSNSQDHILKLGDRIEIKVGIVHRVINLDSTSCRYLVIQGPGVYDFIEA